MNRSLGTAVVLLACTLPLVAQAVALEISPNPVQPGAPITLTITEANGTNLVAYRTASTGGLCPPQVYDMPGGSLQFCGGFLPLCSSSGTPLPPCGSISGTITPCQPAGTWWLKVDYLVAGSFVTDWVCFTVASGPNDPVLSNAAPPTIGQPFAMSLSAPLSAGMPYIAGISATTNTGIVLSPTLSVCLDDDALLQLSVLAPPPTLLVNFVNLLDGAGNSPPIVINLPNVPALQCKRLHVQAVVDPTGIPSVTNVLNLAIQ